MWRAISWATVSREPIPASAEHSSGLPREPRPSTSGSIETHQTVANAVNNGSNVPLTVVGVTTSKTGSAVRWVFHSENSTWTFDHLEALIGANCGWTQLTEALDVNDDGWIVGYSVQGAPPIGYDRGFLLVPLGTCPWDVDGSGDVGSADLSEVVLNWGDCPVPATQLCLADVDGDCTVGAADIAAVITHWGNCPGTSESATNLPTLAEIVKICGDNTDALAAAIEALSAMQNGGGD